MNKISKLDPNLKTLQQLLVDAPDAWEVLVDQYSGFLLAISNRTFAAYGFRASEQDREDAVAEVWRNLLENDKRLVRKCIKDGSLTPTLHVLARNRSVDIMRKSRMHLVDTTEDIFANMLEYKPDENIPRQIAAIKEAIKEIPEREQVLINLFFLQGKKYRQIETLTGIPLNSIGPTLARAVERLRTHFEHVDV